MPSSLHARFDEGNMNAEIVSRLERSFQDEWMDKFMSANDLIDHVELPAVLRVKSTGNGHDDISRLCDMLSSLPVEAVMLGVSKSKQLIVVIQLERTTLLMDAGQFVLDSSGREIDMHRLIACLDVQDLLKACLSVAQSVVPGETPSETLDRLCSLPNKQGLLGVRELCRSMNPSYMLDV